MPAGDLYLLQDFQDYAGGAVDIINAYAYRQTSGAGVALDLANAFEAQLLPDIVAAQSAVMRHHRADVINLDDPADFDSSAYAGSPVGSRGGDGLPAFVAYAFKYVRTTRAVRNGQKRIPGVAEPDQANGVVVGGITTLLGALETALESTLTDGSGNVWTPRIYRRAEPSRTPPVVRADFPISNVLFSRISTQNSRK